jgi:hypothetical protein
MKLNHAPQTGLRRRKPGQPDQKMAFWGGILILCLFELVLMSKSWSPDTAEHIFAFNGDQAQAADGVQAAPGN